MKRVTYEVRYQKTKDLWFVYRNNKHLFESGYEQKNIAIEDAAECAKEEWEDLWGKPTELIIKNKDGKIGKGSASRRTYGKDPRSKG